MTWDELAAEISTWTEGARKSNVVTYVQARNEWYTTEIGFLFSDMIDKDQPYLRV